MEYCICRHKKNAHWDNIINNCYYEGMNLHDLMFINAPDNITGCKCRKFKLDNLKLIEDLAKAKGLI